MKWKSRLRSIFCILYRTATLLTWYRMPKTSCPQLCLWILSQCILPRILESNRRQHKTSQFNQDMLISSKGLAFVFMLFHLWIECFSLTPQSKRKEQSRSSCVSVTCSEPQLFLRWKKQRHRAEMVVSSIAYIHLMSPCHSVLDSVVLEGSSVYRVLRRETFLTSIPSTAWLGQKLKLALTLTKPFTLTKF